MSTAAHVLVDQVLQRVRSVTGVTATRPFVLRVLSSSQNLINAVLKFVLDESTLVTEPERVFYPVRTLLPEAQKPLFIQETGRDLVYAPWRTLWYMKRGWLRQLGEQHQLWSLIGRDLLVVWPARRVPSSLTVTSSRLIPPLASEQAIMEMPDDTLSMVIDLAEVLTLLRMRNTVPAAEAMASLAGRMKERGE